MLPAEVIEWCSAQGYGEITNTRSITGGCINRGMVLQMTSGSSLFLKSNSNTPVDMFAREADGLRALNVTGGPRVPQVYLVGSNFILLEDLKPARRAADYWEILGLQLAALHNHTTSQFGFEQDNYIGSTPQPNTWIADGYEFFAHYRLLFQARLAHQNHLLDSRDLNKVEALSRKLKDYIPEQPPALIHGDLWGGNAITDASGKPTIIDPAVHYGWSESELGMTYLFGGFTEAFYKSYQSAHPLHPGLKERISIYNLYHLLNHLNLFGMSYHGQVIDILRRYV